MQEGRVNNVHQQMGSARATVEEHKKQCCSLKEELHSNEEHHDQMRQTIMQLSQRLADSQQKATADLNVFMQDKRNGEISTEQGQQREQHLLRERDEALLTARRAKVSFPVISINWSPLSFIIQEKQKRHTRNRIPPSCSESFPSWQVGIHFHACQACSLVMKLLL
jgi:chromosome segregation ATPase